MPVSCQEFLRSAFLLADGTAEIDFRNAVSRAHYAAFHACTAVKRFCPPVKIDDPTMGHHEKLVLLFKKYPTGKPGDKSAQKIGMLMNQTRIARGQADYDIGDNFGMGFAKTIVRNAERIIKLTAEFALANGARDHTGSSAASPTPTPEGESE